MGEVQQGARLGPCSLSASAAQLQTGAHTNLASYTCPVTAILLTNATSDLNLHRDSLLKRGERGDALNVISDHQLDLRLIFSPLIS